VEEAVDVGAAAVEDAPETRWVRALAALAADLLALVAHAHAVGLYCEEAEEAEDAAAAPVGDSEVAHLRALQFRQVAASALATRLRAAGHTSALIEEWAEAEEGERRVRPRLA
jgi:hypothetical protein